MAEQSGIPNFMASSAGTRAVVGHPLHKDASAVLEGLGGSAAGFAARQLTPRIALSADLVLAMTTEQRDAVLEHAPSMLHRTFTVVEAARLASELGAQNFADLASLRPRLIPTDSFDIPDPIGQSPEVFAVVGQRIADSLEPILALCYRSGLAD